GDPTPTLKGPSYIPTLDSVPGNNFVFCIWARSGRVSVEIGHLKSTKPFNQEARLQELEMRVHSVPGMTAKPSFPDIELRSLSEPEVLERFCQEMDWIVDQLRRANSVRTAHAS